MKLFERIHKELNEYREGKFEDKCREYLHLLSKPFENLKERNIDIKHINYKLYHLLCNPFIYVLAYSNISRNFRALSKGIIKDEEIMEAFSFDIALKISKKFRTNSYTWQPTRRIYIQKLGKNKKRPIETPTQIDRIVQEAIRCILESIFEPEFYHFEKKNNYKCTNYGFRSNLSTWDAVETIKDQSQQANYGIDGDIIDAYNNVDHKILINILSTRIKDKKFLKVINNLLKSGVMYQNIVTDSLLGTPQRGIISPLLFNIYMFSFDKFIYNDIILPNQNLNSKPKKNPKHTKISREIKKLINDYRITRNQNTMQIINENIKIRSKTPSYVLSTLPTKLIYVRYADDWVLLLTGNISKCKTIKNKIQEFLINKLRLELDNNKTNITNIIEGIKFLGYNIIMNSHKQGKITRIRQRLNNKTTIILKKSTVNRQIGIIPDKYRIISNMICKGYCDKSGFPTALRQWSIQSEFEIVSRYRDIMIGIFNYYSLCDNNYVLNRVSYILQYSCAKTLATKLNCSMSRIFSKYGKNMDISLEYYKNNEKLIKSTKLIILKEFKINKKTKKLRKNKENENRFLNTDAFKISQNWRTIIKLFLNCTICGISENICMHHTNSL